MKKSNFFIIFLILLLTTAYASLNTSLNTKSYVSIGVNPEDFDIYIANIFLNEVNYFSSINSSMNAFSLNITDKENIVDIYVVNNATQYDENINIICNNNDDVNITYSYDNLIKAQQVLKGTIIVSKNNDEPFLLSCNLSNTEVETDHVEEKIKTVLFSSNGATNDTPYKQITELKYGLLPTPVKSGYKFLNWYNEANELIKDTTIINNFDDQVLHSEWDEIVSPPTINSSASGWSSDDVIVSLSSAGSAPSGIKNYEYYISTNNENPALNAVPSGNTTGNISLSNVGKFFVWYRTVSNSGNKSEWSNSINVNIDKSAPVANSLSFTPGYNNILVNLNISDDASGIIKYKVFYKLSSSSSYSSVEVQTSNITSKTYSSKDIINLNYSSNYNIYVTLYDASGKTTTTAVKTATTLSPIAVVGNKGFASITNAVTYIDTGQSTIKLLSNTSEKVTTSKGNITINLNSKTVTGNFINNGSTLTINSGTINTTDSNISMLNNSGTVNMTSVNINAVQAAVRINKGYMKITSSTMTSTGSSGIVVYNDGNLDLYGSTITGDGGCGTFFMNGTTGNLKVYNNTTVKTKKWSGLCWNSTGTATLASINASGLACGMELGAGSITISAGTISGGNYGIDVTKNAKIAINGNIQVSATNWAALHYNSSASSTISAGNYTGTGAGLLLDSTGSLKVTGGTYTGNYSIIKNSGTISVSGVTLNGPASY